MTGSHPVAATAPAVSPPDIEYSTPDEWREAILSTLEEK
jgi:hypothetical protein